MPGPLPDSEYRRRPLSEVPARAGAQNGSQSVFSIGLTRLAPVIDAPGLILLTVDPSAKAGETNVGALTDAALRGRLGQSTAHSANEIAAIRRALAGPEGQITIYEHWPDLSRCLEFWSGFAGLQMRRISWTCSQCSATIQETIGGSVGETFPRPCKCGHVTRITLPKYAPGHESQPPR